MKESGVREGSLEPPDRGPQAVGVGERGRPDSSLRDRGFSLSYAGRGGSRGASGAE